MPESVSFLEQLNPQQGLAATHGFEPLLIIAGAGTGKTTTLAYRVAWQISQNVDPSRILLLTFTRRAAAELVKRADIVLSQQASEPGMNRTRVSDLSTSKKIWGGTFHSIASRLLRKYGQLIGLSPEYTIIDRGDAEDLMQLARTQLDLARGKKRFPSKATCLDIYSWGINCQKKLDEILKEDYPEHAEEKESLRALFNKFMDLKAEQGVLDYDDLLLFWRALLEDERGGAKLRSLFDCVLVDEYQDTNVLQAEIIRLLRPDGRGLTVVGDDAQSIYSFRAAEIQNILDFPKIYPGTYVIPLEQNYRSTETILEASNRVIAGSAQRYEKNLWSKKASAQKPLLVNCKDDQDEVEHIVDAILKRHEEGVPFAQQAVLFRAAYHSAGLELELAKRQIPFHKYGGLKFVEAAHIKDVVAYLRLADNYKDRVAGLRVVTLLPGFGPKKAEQFLDELASLNGNWGMLTGFARPSRITEEDWQLFVLLMRTLSQTRAETLSVAQQVGRVIKVYTPLLEEKYDNVTARKKDLEQLASLAARYEHRTDFLTELALDPPSSTQDFEAEKFSDDDYLVLSTIHSAKGLEWDSVYIMHVYDGSLPSEMAISTGNELDEERRLLYVAMTRAKNHLELLFPYRVYSTTRNFFGQALHLQLSRFLGSPVKEALESISTKAVSEMAGKTVEPITTSGTADVQKKLRSLWD
jgi:DNA helicase-2/ATP-dependent DNA helicase PcrA